MSELTTCANCDKEVAEDSDFCPHCGYLFKDAPLAMCDTHHDSEASGVCIICQNLVCPRCREVRSKRLFCAEHRTVTVEQDWAMVIESPSLIDAEIQKSYLEDNGIQALGQSLGVRMKNRGTARVYVPIPDYLRSMKLLEEIDRTEPTIEEVGHE